MTKELNYIINHVFLPPKLPQKDDCDVSKTNALIDMMLEASEVFQDHIPKHERSEWVPCIKMIRSMRELKDRSGNLMPKNVETALRTMLDGGTSRPHLMDRISV